MIFIVSAFQSVNYLNKPIALSNCYLPNCTIRLTQANQSICIDLESAKNKECQVLERGINVTVNLVIENQSSGSTQTTKTTIFGFYYGFNYSETKTICIDSDNPSNASQDFYLASSAQVIFNSIGYTSTFAPGLIQRISGDNSDFLNETISTVYYDKTELCAHAVIDTTYIQNFNVQNILNATLVISDYFGNGKRENITVYYDPQNKSALVNLTFDSQKQVFKFCYLEKGLTIYPYLDTSKSNAYLYVYYSVDKNTTPGASSNKMAVYLEGKIVNNEFTSLNKVFQEINLVIMQNEVAIQSIMSSDPKLLQEAQQYTEMLAKHPNNQGMRLAYIYCINDPSLFASAYNSHKVGFSNVSQLLNENLFAPNKSVQSSVDMLQQYTRSEGGCQPTFKYQMFAFDNKDIIASYSQQGNLAHYSCFTQVKYSSSGDLEFVRNDLNCTRFNESQTVYFIVLDINTRKPIYQQQVQDFSINDLTYNIPAKVKINPTNNTLQILNQKQQMVDMITFFSVTEVDDSIVAGKAINIGVFSGLQLVSISTFILLRKTVIPKMVEKVRNKRQLMVKMKTAMMDL